MDYPQVVVAFTWQQADYLLNLLAPLKEAIGDIIYDQIEQSQEQALDDVEDEE